MPNHVCNNVTISGNKENLAKIKNLILVNEEYIEFIKSRNDGLEDGFKLELPKLGDLSFNRLIPQPTTIFQGDLSSEDEEKYGAENCWYEWGIEHWGTKWDAYEVFVDTDDNAGWMTITFWTAYSEPIPYMNKLAELCHENDCCLDWEFANEDFDQQMGSAYLDDDSGELVIGYADCDPDLYGSVWGCLPPYLEEEFEEGN